MLTGGPLSPLLPFSPFRAGGGSWKNQITSLLYIAPFELPFFD